MQVLFYRRVTEWAAGREITSDLVAEYLETQHLGFKPHEREVDGAYTNVWAHLQDEEVITPEFGVEMMMTAAEAMTERTLAES